MGGGGGGGGGGIDGKQTSGRKARFYMFLLPAPSSCRFTHRSWTSDEQAMIRKFDVTSDLRFQESRYPPKPSSTAKSAS